MVSTCKENGAVTAGGQFRSRKYVTALRSAGLTGSMGVGACGDNAAMESFFALLQKNVLDRHQRETRDQLRLAIVTWIEKTYHRRRRQRTLSRLTPVEFETIHTSTWTHSPPAGIHLCWLRPHPTLTIGDSGWQGIPVIRPAANDPSTSPTAETP